MNRVLSDHVEFRGLLRAWLTAGRAHAAVEGAGRAAACGYCFGGMAMFEMVCCCWGILRQHLYLTVFVCE